MLDNMIAPQLYNPEKVAVMVGGIPTVGFADGSMVSVSYDSEAFKKSTGVAGKIDFIQNPDKSGKVTISLKHTSPSNFYFKSVLAKNREGSTVDIIITDANSIAGGNLTTLSYCVVEKQPDMKRTGDIDTQEWIFLFARGEEPITAISGLIPTVGVSTYNPDDSGNLTKAFV